MSEAVSSGREAHASSDWETCVSQLSRAVETLPWDWALLETRSECNARRGDLEASHRDLRQMLRLMPASGAGEDSKRLFSTYLRLAQSVYDSGDTEQALRYDTILSDERFLLFLTCISVCTSICTRTRTKYSTLYECVGGH